MPVLKMSLPAKIIKEMAGIWEIDGEPTNLEQYIRAKGKLQYKVSVHVFSSFWTTNCVSVDKDCIKSSQLGQADRRRNTEFQLQANNRSTVSILFPDEKTVQLLFTVGETKKIEPITAMLDAPVPMIDPETSTMLDIELLVEVFSAF